MGKGYFVLPAGCPIEQPVDRDASLVAIDKIKSEVSKHIGQLAIFHQSEKRTTIPRIVEIYGIYPCFVVVRYPCYAPDGSFRQYLTDCIQWSSLYCRTEALEFLDCDDI